MIFYDLRDVIMLLCAVKIGFMTQFIFQRTKKILIFSVLSIICWTSTDLKGQNSSWIRDSLDMVVRQAMQEEKIPGLAVAIIKDGRVVLQKTYGQRERDAFGDIDEHTLFMVGSNSKAITATSLTLLEYEGKLLLNDRVTKWMPSFRLYDPNATALVTIRDLLCHRIGTRTFQGDFTFWESTLTRQQIIERMVALQPQQEFRGSFGYCNSAFLTAGEIIPLVAKDTTWEDFVRTRFFKPLRMERSLALAEQMRTASNAAKAHTYYDGRYFTLDYGRIDNLAPAGSISASISDWTHWVQMQLDTGRYEGRQVIPKKVVLQTWNAQNIVNQRTGYSYGLGWFIRYHQGKKIIEHTGGVNGFLTSTAFVPEERLGVIVFTNTDNNALFESLTERILNEYLGGGTPQNIQRATTDWKAAQQKQIDELAQHYAMANAQKRRDTYLFDIYTGTYTNPLYGEVTVKVVDGRLRLFLSNHGRMIPCVLDYMKPQTFLCTFGSPTFGIHPLTFQTDGANVTGLTLKTNDFIEYEPYVFTKK
jgi:CubicO group peptidase (beta-lactamase class C family)